MTPFAQVVAAIGVALLVLVTAVLPAEYGIDPTGLGAATGLTALSPPTDPQTAAQTRTTAALTQHLDERDGERRTPALASEQLTFELGPFESTEYKYRLLAGDGLVYQWRSSHAVLVNFHSDVRSSAADADAAVSFSSGRSRSNHGIFVAPFDGLHGWFWQNRGLQPVTLELQTTGFFNTAIDYRDGFPFEKNLSEQATLAQQQR